MIVRSCKDCGKEYEDFPEGRKGRCRPCHNSYRRSLYHNPRSRIYTRKSLTERYLEKVNQLSDTECWPWLGSHSPQGYGKINEGGRGKNIGAHRVAWEIHIGQIPDKLTVDHLCLNRWCQNPKHMELVTLEENGKRGALRRWYG